MRITFEDRSYVEFLYRDKNVTVIQGAVSKVNGKKVLSVTSSEITFDQFTAMVEDIKSKIVESAT